MRAIVLKGMPPHRPRADDMWSWARYDIAARV
jgi:hypothetical protein